MPPISFHYLYIDSHINAHIHFLQYSLAFHTSSDLSRMYPMSIILPSSGVYKPHPTDHMFSLPIPKSTYRYTYLVATNINAAAYPNPTPCAPRHTPLHVHPVLPRTPTRLAGMMTATATTATAGNGSLVVSPSSSPATPARSAYVPLSAPQIV